MYDGLSVIDACDGAGETVITEFDGVVLVDEHVRRFNVSMNYLALVKVLDSTQQIVDDSDNVILLDHTLGDTGEQFLKVKAKVLLDDVDVVELQVTILVVAEWHDANIM